MNLVEGYHSIVLLSDAITPLALNSLKDLQRFGKSSNILLLPPLARVEFGTQINLQVQEGRVEILWKQPVLESGFSKAKKLAEYFLGAYQSFEIKAIGINFNGLWLSDDDIDFKSWRSRFFNAEFMAQEHVKDLLSMEFKISVQKKDFVRNLSFSERISDGNKGILANVNNHFDSLKNYVGIVKSADKLLQETVDEIEKFWIIA
ncbi:MAG: hypothetical protein D6813_03730 [Calditrichaeota bacterium]|nr:MAG: hypothetical protein D6813_03730 [Calditrichota bacterium]